MIERAMVLRKEPVFVFLAVASLYGPPAPAQQGEAAIPPATPPSTAATPDSGPSLSESATRLPEIVITGRSDSLVGSADSANQGTVGASQLRERPLLRPGELAETVPGLIITQHSSSGKANQYFLRGFNLDHGTDLATYVNGVPVNLPTHAHGQGYTDLNFIIPELVETIDFRKGPYFADSGDFASAGEVRLEYWRSLPQAIARVEGGIFNLLNARVNDIEYYYTSRLSGEPAEGVDDRHFHPAEPISFRLGLIARF